VLLTDYLRTNIPGINGEELYPNADKICIEFSEELQRRTERKSVPETTKKNTKKEIKEN